MTREEKLALLHRAADHLDRAAAQNSGDVFCLRLYDAIRCIGAVVKELVKEQADDR